MGRRANGAGVILAASGSSLTFILRSKICRYLCVRLSVWTSAAVAAGTGRLRQSGLPEGLRVGCGTRQAGCTQVSAALGNQLQTEFVITAFKHADASRIMAAYAARCDH